MTECESKAISNLRFPLMMGVVLIHCVVIDPEIARNQGLFLTSVIVQLCSFGLTSPCVPLFFFISGYLFFFKYSQRFFAEDYGKQIFKRIKTVLIPYLFWNLVVLGYFAFMHKFTPSLVNPEFNNVYHYSWIQWLRSFWDYPGNQPVCFQFWFLRDLMIMMVCSPIIYIIAKYGKQLVIVILSVLYLILPNVFPHQMALTFFLIGAAFAIHEWNFAEMACKYAVYVALLWGVLLIYNNIEIGGGKIASSALTFSGIIVYLALAAFTPENKSKKIHFLASSSFFIYAFHGFPLGVIIKLSERIIQPSDNYFWLLDYLCCFSLIVVMSLFLYWLLQRYLPRLTAFITGNR